MCFDTPVSLPLIAAGSIKAYATYKRRALGASARHLRPLARRDLPALSFPVWYALFAAQGHAEGDHQPAQCRRQCRHWPTLRRDLGLPISGSRFSHASDRPRRRSGALQKAQIEKWWPLIKEFGTRRNEGRRTGSLHSRSPALAISATGQRPPSRLRRHHDRCTQIAADLLHRPSRLSWAKIGSSAAFRREIV